MRTSFIIIILAGFLFFLGCDDDSNNNNNNNNNKTCEGDAPLADLQEGVCSGTLKVCDATSLEWVEPDYSQLENYESQEISCDGLDNNCNGETDEGLGTIDYYPDNDDDGYGDALAEAVTACGTPIDHVPNNLDCNDSDADISPDAPEICNGVDDNCDDIIDAGPCQDHASCADNGGVGPAYCQCNTGYVELPSSPGICQQASIPASGDLAFTEIMLQPLNSNTQIEGQYFEIVNTTDATLLLSDIGFYATNTSTDATSAITDSFLLPPHSYFTVATSDASNLNGGIVPDHVFTTMPQLSTAEGYLEIYSSGSQQAIDSISWDDTWNHLAGASLTLSPEAPRQNLADLNDNPLHWCNSRFSTLPQC